MFVKEKCFTVNCEEVINKSELINPLCLEKVKLMKNEKVLEKD